jgi:transposase
MGKEETSKLNHKCLGDLRRRAVVAVLASERPEFIARVFGVSPGAIHGWLSLYRNGGWNALDASERRSCLENLDGPSTDASTKERQ